MQPGGKPNDSESPLETLARELREELNCSISLETAVRLGIFTAEAANEPNSIVEAILYQVELSGTPRVSGELEELVWIAPAESSSFPLAPLTRDCVFPLVRDR